MQTPKILLAAVAAVALHALAMVFFLSDRLSFTRPPEPPKAEEQVVYLEVAPAAPEQTAPPAPTAEPPAQRPATAAATAARRQTPPTTVLAPPAAVGAPAFMDAPPAPTAQEWALAATYKLKNSKRYRHTWSQQVRSMMGTAIEGPDQGVVRFRVEIAPDGTLARLETLWTTSPVAEQLARKAIENMPPLPPTPTGKPLIFEKTISFQPFEADGPPVYKDDCLPDPPVFRNPFVWDGTSPPIRTKPEPVEKPDPHDLAECLRQLPQDTLEAESAHDKRQLDQWWSSQQGR